MSLLDDTVIEAEDDFAYEDTAKQKPQDSLLLYEAESQILALYDKLIELRLEKAILEAQIQIPPANESPLDAEAGSRLKTAERECLEARAAYLLKNSIVETVISMDPVLNAIHSGADAAPSERILHPLIDRRDILGIAQTNLSTRLNSMSKTSTVVEAQNIGALGKNRELTKMLLQLTKQMTARRESAINEYSSSDRLHLLRDDSKTARKRWKVMKSFVSAVIVGSGIDWGRNEELRQAVIDEED